MEKILVIVVSYNFEPWIDRCLSSLRNSQHPVDAVVIDNCSQDRTTDIIARRYPEVRLICNTANLGFGQANNIGMEIAIREGYQAVFLLNQDAWIDAHTIGTLFKLSKEHPEYGILSPVHLTGKSDGPDQGFSVYAHIRQISDLPKDKELVTVPFVNAAFWMIPLPVLRSVGGFSPLFYHYGEDKDYSNRIKYHGYFTGYSPAVFGCHDRAGRKESHEFFLRSELIYLLTEFANPNYSFCPAFGYSVLASIKKGWKCLLKGKFKDTGAYLNIAFKLTMRSKEILGYRKQSCRKSTNYLHV